jgi:uncharacterized protein (TIGR02147 family)
MSVFKYKHYKSYFLDVIKAKGSSGRGEYRRIAEYLGVHPTLISQILSGEKDFSPEQVLNLAKHYGLGKAEGRYLVILVEIERSGSKDLRDQFIEMRDEMQKQSLQLSKRLTTEKTLSDYEKSVFYSSWVYSAVHLMTTLEKPIDFEFICQRLRISSERAREVLDFLKRNGLVSEENGKLLSGPTSTHLPKGSPFLIKHHTNWRVRALEKSENLGDEELMYSVNVSLSKKDFQKLREEMVVFIREFLKTVHESPAEDLAQLNLDFFWV